MSVSIVRKMSIKTFFTSLFNRILAFFLCCTTDAEKETDAIVDTLADIAELIDPPLAPFIELTRSEAHLIAQACEREGSLLRARTIKRPGPL